MKEERHKITENRYRYSLYIILIDIPTKPRAYSIPILFNMPKDFATGKRREGTREEKIKVIESYTMGNSLHAIGQNPHMPVSKAQASRIIKI